MSAQPLRLAILWHQHQPYYKVGDNYLLPWARLHATKDYRDMASLLDAYPRIRQTVNVVPSLLDQLADYGVRGAGDTVLDLTMKPAESLTLEDKVSILRTFFLCNVQRMILPYPRYAELYHRIGNVRLEPSLARAVAVTFSVEDWRDLQVWYVLTWIGEQSRKEAPFAQLIAQGRGFTEPEKQELVEASRRIVADVIPTWRRLLERGQIELSVTPYYHPILPLLCDSHSALEAMPNARMPRDPIVLPDDARHHVASAARAFEEHFGRKPRGMWPAEGSVSDDALSIMRAEGFEWGASDEGILRRTLGEEWSPVSKYFPHLFKTRSGPLWMVFRDHDLSDAIGFVYASWDAEEAASDFYNRLVEIRNRIVHERGADALADAIVPVILDGENCWEYYEKNGVPFLDSFYRLLSASNEIVTTTIGDALGQARQVPERTRGRIYAGSWIGTNFQIWIGGDEDNHAWEALLDARKAIDAARNRLDDDSVRRAMEHIYIAQGSDWFWWYGDENQSANQDDFDDLFRLHLRSVYEIIGATIPEDLLRPIRRGVRLPRITPPRGRISPIVDGRTSSEREWSEAGYFVVERIGGAMHYAEVTERRFWFGSDPNNFYFRFDTGGGLRPGQKVCLTISGHHSILLHYTPGRLGVEVIADDIGFASIGGIQMVVGETLEGAIPIIHLAEEGALLSDIGVIFEIFEGGHQTERFPTQGEARCTLSTNERG